MWNGRPKPQAIASMPNEWFVLCGKNPVYGGRLGEGTISQDELARLRALESWWRSEGESPVDAGSARHDNTSSDSLLHSSDKNKTLSQAENWLFFNATVKVMYINVNSVFRDKRPKYEIYVADGTVNPRPTRNFHQVDAGIPPGALICLNVFGDVSERSESLFKQGAILRFPNVIGKEYNGLELKWSDKVTSDQLHQGWKDRACSAVSPDDPRAIEIEE